MSVTRGSTRPIRKSTNPFMTTSNHLLGMNVNDKIIYTAPKYEENQNEIDKDKEIMEQYHKDVANFMYKKISEKVGQGIKTESTHLSEQMDTINMKKKLEKESIVEIKHINVFSPKDIIITEPEFVHKKDINLSAVTSGRSEHPMYSTSNREIGTNKTQIQIDMDRKGIPNSFTNSFNGLRYRDYGLNTTITKSKISDQLSIT